MVSNPNAAVSNSVAPLEVLRAASASPEIFLAISELPVAASAAFRVISLVVAACSSTTSPGNNNLDIDALVKKITDQVMAALKGSHA